MYNDFYTIERPLFYEIIFGKILKILLHLWKKKESVINSNNLYIKVLNKII